MAWENWFLMDKTSNRFCLISVNGLIFYLHMKHTLVILEGIFQIKIYKQGSCEMARIHLGTNDAFAKLNGAKLLQLKKNSSSCSSFGGLLNHFILKSRTHKMIVGQCHTPITHKRWLTLTGKPDAPVDLVGPKHTGLHSFQMDPATVFFQHIANPFHVRIQSLRSYMDIHFQALALEIPTSVCPSRCFVIPRVNMSYGASNVS